jgi:hypothetical protein
MNFPDWAPKALCDYYEKASESIEDSHPFECPFSIISESYVQSEDTSIDHADIEDLSSDLLEKKHEVENITKVLNWYKLYDPILNNSDMYDNNKELLLRLLTNDDMVRVWIKYKKSFPNDPCLNIAKEELFPYIIISYFASMREIRTEAEKMAEIKDIHNKLTALIKVIKGTEYDFRANLFLSYLDCGIEKLEERIGSDDEFRASLDRLTLSDILYNMAEGILFDIKLSDNLHQPSPETHPPFKYLSKPRAKYAQANRLIREMSIVFQLHLGDVHPRLLARLVRVIMQPHISPEMDIDETFVKSSLREWHKTNPHLQQLLADNENIRALLSWSLLIP